MNWKDGNSWAQAGLGMLTGGITDEINAVKNIGGLPDYTDIENKLKDIQQAGTQSASSFNDLQSLFNSTPWAKTNYTKKDLLGDWTPGKQAGFFITHTLEQSAKGAAAGASSGNPWGILIGAVAGATLGNIGAGATLGKLNNSAERNAYRFNLLGDTYNRQFINNIRNNANQIGLNMKYDDLLHYSALGGHLHNTGLFSNGVRFIENGGSHEQNPLGGVPQGIALDGLQNLVEEGEVIYNDYVYSKRLKIPKTDNESLGLKKNKDYTYAEAAEEIQKMSEERPNDPISKHSLEIMMGRLQDSQENLKQKRKEQSLKRTINSMSPEEQMALVMQMQDEQPYALGGYIFKDGGRHLHYPDLNDPNSSWLHEPRTPWSAGFTDSPMERANQAAINRFNYVYPDYLTKGVSPLIKQAVDNAPSEPYSLLSIPVVPASQLPVGDKEIKNPKNNKFKKELANTPEVEGGKKEDGKKDDEKFEYSKLAQYLRAAPVFGSTAGAIMSLFDSPNYANIAAAENKFRQIPRVTPTFIGGKQVYNPIDINYIGNQLNNQNIGTRRALQEYSTGNKGVAVGSLLASNLQGQNAYSNALIQAMNSNIENKLKYAEFNRGIDATNAQAQLQADLANQQRGNLIAQGFLQTGQLRDNELAKLQAARSAQLTAMYNNTGSLGSDMLAREMNAWLANRGAYAIGSDELAKIINTIEKKYSDKFK